MKDNARRSAGVVVFRLRASCVRSNEAHGLCQRGGFALRELLADEAQRDRTAEVLAADLEAARGALFLERAQ